ncbi:MAG: GntR family transcriptional regulator [Phycisphaeraceae bacterium]|nr:GntR family transcriptional regulator [Phycisphaeraceae bacterium]
MFIRIEKGSSVPISRQIASQVRAQCLAGTLPAGARVPSVRELAEMLTVNPNTILRVYEKLTSEGYLERRHGSGTFVALKPPLSQLNGQRDKFEEELGQLIRHGRMLGLEAAELRAAFEQALDNANISGSHPQESQGETST